MIQVILSSPDTELYNGEAKRAIIRTTSGEITVLAGHEPLMTTIASGEVIIENEVEENENKREIFSAYNGVVNIENAKGKTRVVILVENTENLKDVDQNALQVAITRAKEANKEKQDDNLLLDTGLLRDMNKIRLARKYKV
jgi:F-type H+-transporting ATPase subunit epsilon